MNQKILIGGGTCSGKSTLALEIASRFCFSSTSFGAVLRSHAGVVGMGSTAAELQKLGQELIETLGYDGFLKWIIAHSPEIHWAGPLIIDGVRHASMYEAIIRTYPNSVLVFCDCARGNQLSRLIKRNHLSKEEADRILSHPLERGVESLRQLAHIVFNPETPIKDLLLKVDFIMRGAAGKASG